MPGKFHCMFIGLNEGPKTLRIFLQSCSRGGGDKSYRHADQWWPEADLLNVQNFVKSYLGPIACIGINSKSVRNSFACKRHRKEKRHNFRKPQSAKHLCSVYARTVCQLEENFILIMISLAMQSFAYNQKLQSLCFLLWLKKIE